MRFHLKAGVAALALILAPLALQAAPKGEHGHSGSHGASSQTQHGNGHAYGHDSAARGDEVEAGDDVSGGGDTGEEIATGGNHPCGWGLANRDTACVPPGQAARGVTTEDWIGAPADDLAAGDTVSSDGYGLIANTDQLGLDTSTLADGQAYALVGDTIVVIDEATGEIVSVVRRAAFPGHSNG